VGAVGGRKVGGKGTLVVLGKWRQRRRMKVYLEEQGEEVKGVVEEQLRRE